MNKTRHYNYLQVAQRLWRGDSPDHPGEEGGSCRPRDQVQPEHVTEPRGTPSWGGCTTPLCYSLSPSQPQRGQIWRRKGLICRMRCLNPIYSVIKHEGYGNKINVFKNSYCVLISTKQHLKHTRDGLKRCTYDGEILKPRSKISCYFEKLLRKSFSRLALVTLILIIEDILRICNEFEKTEGSFLKQ